MEKIQTMSSSSSSSKVEMGGGGDNNNSNVNNDNNNNKKRAVTSTSTSTSALSPRCSSTATTTSSSNKKQKMMNTSATTISTTTPTTTTTTASIEQPIFCWVTQGKTDHYATIVDPLVLAVLAKERKKADGTSRNNVTRSGTKRTCRAAGNSNANATGLTDLARVLPRSMTEMEIKWCSTKHKQKVLVSSVKLEEDQGHDNTSTVLESPEGSSKRSRRSSTPAAAAAAMTVAASHTPSVLRGGRARGRERQSPVQLLSSKLTGSDHGDDDGTTTTGVTPLSVQRGGGQPRKQPPPQQQQQTQPDLSPIVGGTDEEEQEDDDGGGGGGKETTTRTSTTPPPSSSLGVGVGVIRRGREQPEKQRTTHNNNGSTSDGLEGSGGDAMMGGTGMGVRMGGSSSERGGQLGEGGSGEPGGYAEGRMTTASNGTMKSTSTRSHGSSARSGNRNDDHDHDHDDDDDDDVPEDEYKDGKVRSQEDKLSCDDDDYSDADDRTVAMSPERDDDTNVTAAGHNNTITGEGNNNKKHIDNNTGGKTCNDNYDDGAAATKEFKSNFKSSTMSTATATATARGGVEEEEDVEAVHVRVAAFEFHYYVFQLLFMIGFLVHCRKYNDRTGPVTMIHIVLFVITSSVESPDDASTVNVNAPSSGNGSRKKQTLVFTSLVLLRELFFLTFLGLVIYTMVEQSPETANHHMVMGFISFFCLLPPQLKRVLTQLHVFLVVLFQSSSTSSSPDDTSGSGTLLGTTISQTTQDGLNRTRIMIVMMYWMAGFHKLNTDFLFNPQVSCAFHMLWKYLPLLNIQNYDDLEEDHLLWVHPMLKYLPFLGVVVELVPPILLSIPHPRVQHMGIMMLLSLHLLLLPIGFADFGAIAQSFLWLFIHPLRLCVDHSHNNNNTWVLKKSYFHDMAVCLCGLQFCNILYMYNMTDEEADNAEDNLREEGMVIFAYFVMWSTIFRTRTRTSPTATPSNDTDDVDVDVDAGVVVRQHRAVRLYLPTSIWSKVGVLTFLVYTFNPYLGLKTTGCVTMFSNLRTEENGSHAGRGNHLLFGANYLKLWTYQEDKVTVLDWNQETHSYLNEQQQGEGWMLDTTDDDYEGNNNNNNYNGGGEGELYMKVGWSYQKLMFDQLLWKHLSKESQYYPQTFDLRTREEYPTQLYLKIRYHDTIYETQDLLHDPVFYHLFIEDTAPWYLSKYFHFRAMPPAQTPQQCEW